MRERPASAGLLVLAAGVSTLGKAKSMLRQAHCRVGTVAHAYSRLKKKGIVIGQSRRPGRVVPNGTKVGLTVSRGRRRH
jgi:beta-lactam-binding protein with PASTA domain